MLDNRTGSDAHPGDPLVGEFVWTRELNQYGWQSYLGQAEAEAPQVPARLRSFADLPPTWMFTATLDLFRDEKHRVCAKADGRWRAVRTVRLPGGLSCLSKDRTSRPE